jgi:NAD-dependent deacetylase
MDMKELRDYIDEHGPEYMFKEVRAKNAATLIKKAGHLVVLTGAGISTESGIPDYRSTGGLWDGHKPEEISHWSKIGTLEFRKFMTERYKEFQEHSPNIAHEILAAWQENQRVTIITQNIDGYHQRAGAKNVIEMHGHMRWLECTECETKHQWTAYTELDSDKCEICGDDVQHGGILRPPVVLFGENLPALEWFKAQQAVQTADVVLVIGTSLQVAPFNELVDMAYNGGNGAKIIIATKSDTPYDGVASIRFHEGIGETMSVINNLLDQ